MVNARLHRRRGRLLDAEGFEPDAGSAPPGSLVDDKLSPEAREAARAVRLSLVEPVGRRAVAVFLGREDYQKVGGSHGRLMACLLLECLPRFIHARGGEVVHTMLFGDHGEVLNAVQHAISLDGQTRLALGAGLLFAHSSDERVVVSAEPRYYPGGQKLAIHVRCSRDPVAFWQDWQAYSREHNYLRGRSFFADGTPIERHRKYTWDDILLPEQTRRTIQTHIQSFLRNRTRLTELGVKPRRGLILAGPPGTGKTLMGKVLADTLNVSFMWVTPRHVREAESFEDIMATARFLAPAVVFLEDLDLFAEEREHRGWMGLGELMNQLDGAADNQDLVIVATTNRLEVIEKALRNRPGRFDRVVEFGPLDEPARRKMLSRLLAKATVNDANVDRLVAATEDYTGAQIEELCATLVMKAVESENVFKGAPRRQGSAVSGGKLSPGIRVGRDLIEASLKEMHVERKAQLGFHAA